MSRLWGLWRRGRLDIKLLCCRKSRVATSAHLQFDVRRFAVIGTRKELFLKSGWCFHFTKVVFKHADHALSRPSSSGCGAVP